MIKKIKKSFMKLGLIQLKARVLVVGLCNSGKTSVVAALAGLPLDVVPTTGFEVETFKLQGKSAIKLTTYDMSGDPKYQMLWKSFYDDSQGVMFVVDSSNRAEFGTARAALQGVVDHTRQKMPLLVMCNKSDLEGAQSAEELLSVLGVDGMTGRTIHIMACSATTNEGIQDGIDWLVKRIRASL